MTEKASPGGNGKIPILRPSAEGLAPADLSKAVGDALAAAGQPKRLTVLVNDPQRDTCSKPILDRIARQINPHRLRLLVATGSHQIPPAQRRQFQAELVAHLPLADVAWHDCRSDKLVSVGGRWRAHRWLGQDGPLLAVGSVEPHYFAGYTGAHKTFTIGCASYEDIEANHAAALSSCCRPGRLSGNPVHEGILDMLLALGRSQVLAAVNLVQVEGQVVGAVGGPVGPCFQAAVALAERVFLRRLPAAADALIVEVTGRLAQSFYQAEKGIKNNEWAVRSGGAMVLIASCRDGLGSRQFTDLLGEAANYAQATRIVERRGYRLGDHKAIRLLHLTDPARRAVRLFLVSDGISPDDAKLLGLTKVADAGDALAAAKLTPGKDRIYRVNDAGNCCVLAGADAPG